MSDRLYLYCRRDPDPEHGRSRAGWFVGETLEGRNVKGRPQYVDEGQARWTGPRLALSERCEVKVLTSASADAREGQCLAWWRYNPESGEVETLVEWGDTGHAKEHTQRCDGVSGSIPPMTGGSLG